VSRYIFIISSSQCMAYNGWGVSEVSGVAEIWVNEVSRICYVVRSRLHFK